MIANNTAEVNTVFTDEGHNLLIACTTQYGHYSQLQQVSEECLELALSIRKLNRAIDSGDPLRIAKERNEVCSEIADVIIMASQARLIFDSETINAHITRKLTRQRERLLSPDYKH